MTFCNTFTSELQNTYIMKTIKNFSEKLNLKKSIIAKVSELNSISGGSITKETQDCPEGNATNTFTLQCGNDTVDTQ